MIKEMKQYLGNIKLPWDNNNKWKIKVYLKLWDQFY